MQPAPPGPRVLVVDDNPASLYSTSRVLSAAGFSVSAASTGTETLARCAMHAPDLVLLDINLPDFDGFEVCRRLRSSPPTERLPVIHLSSTFLDDQARVRGLDAGADSYLTHPVEPVVLVATINAVLRARNAEAVARRREAELRAVFELAPSGICLIDRHLMFRDVNPALAAMLHRAGRELIGRSCTESLVEGDRAGLLRWAAAGERSGQWRGLMSYRKPHGGIVQLDWTVSEYTVPDLLLAVVSDVTERRIGDLERERLLTSERAARAEAERANRLKDEFLATLSHELRTPLNAIVGWAHVLQSGRPSHDEMQKGLGIIERNARLQAQLISDLLDVSRIISGKLTLECGPVVLADMIQAALEGVRTAADGKGVHLQLELDERVPPLMGDASRLQQVVWNLAHNAIKFTPSGGHVHVALRRSGAEVAIEVRDDGAGIAPDFLPHLFERFRQADASVARSHGGLGLGLAIVKQLVEMHGGRVVVHSDGLGQGATFTVWLPLRAVAPAPAPEPGDDSERRALHGLRILVVDDDDDARALVVRLLGERGARVVEAADAHRALDLLTQIAPHLLISDIGMPHQDGYDLIRSVRRRGQALPAIALTAYARTEDEQRALAHGFQLHLAKPIQPGALLQAVVRLTQHQRSPERKPAPPPEAAGEAQA